MNFARELLRGEGDQRNDRATAGLEAATSEARAHDIDATRVREHLDSIEESLARAA